MWRSRTLVLLCVLPLLGGLNCRRESSIRDDADFDPASARAEAARPSSTVVEDISIPVDPTLPNWVVVVELFEVAASGITSGTNSPPAGGYLAAAGPPDRIGAGITSQLISALSRVGNVVIVDYRTFRTNPEKVIAEMRPGELGPFLITGTVTEFNETADLSSQGQTSSGSQASNALESVGQTGLPYTGIVGGVGRLFSRIQGDKQRTETRRKGMVGLDIQIVDPATGRILTSFVADGTFVAVDVAAARSRFGKTESRTNYASSAIGQAQRVAVNNAIRQIHAVLAQSSAPQISSSR